MSSFMLAEMGVSAVSSLANYGVSKIEHRMQQQLTKYRNTMRALSAGESHNAVNKNEAQLRGQFAFADLADQVTSMQDTEAARVAAAAAGAYGGSVDVTLTDMARAAAQKKYAQELSFRGAMNQLDDQRREIDIQKVAGTEINIIPKPSVGNMLLGLTTNLLSIHKNHTPGNNNPNVGR